MVERGTFLIKKFEINEHVSYFKLQKCTTDSVSQHMVIWYLSDLRAIVHAHDHRLLCSHAQSIEVDENLDQIVDQ